MLVDSHAHLDSDSFTAELPEILNRAGEAGVGAILAIGIGEGPAEMHQALDICRRYNAADSKLPRLYASAGIYPHSTTEADDAAFAKLDVLLAEPEVIACGEIGLDYYHQGAPHDVQKRAFIQQMEIAARRNRPILIHCRPNDGDDQCWEDTLALLAEHWRVTGSDGESVGGILHCFSGEWSYAERAMELGFMISFAGHLTYPKSLVLQEVAAKVPLDRILVETDAPYLAPVPYRGQRNEPAYVAQTARFLADLRGISLEELASVTTKNFERLFRLPPGM
ncbi:TatD family hydrolase [Acidicapsa dinghuensis]|uniref:TatD family hydrolase n=1 Tax=Acidicapsa dinghuensis TaxID=2218256 RepID=A0ABW1EJ51_9BACT|nr:TatD family hydrolase [Acidicapsa dinghuensis]